VCDTNQELAKTRQKEWKAEKCFFDYKELLADSNVDAVEILSPQPIHEEMTIRAAEAGKHIALQKPMTINLPSADKMLASVRQSGRVFRISDNYLFYPPIVLAKKMIDQGEIGTPTNLRIKMISGGSGGWDVPASAWAWRTAEMNEGRGFQVFDHGHHLWATAWFLLGEIERVSSWIDSLDGIVDSPAVIMWKHKEGMKYGMCEYSFAQDMPIPSKYYANDEWIEITGTKGILVINRCTGNIYQGPVLSRFDGSKWTSYTDVECDWAQGFIGATNNFIDSIKGDARPLLSGEQGKEILKTTLAIIKSSKERREVYVGEMDRKFPHLYTRKRIKAEKRKIAGKSRFSFPGFGKKDAAYASQAGALTQEMVNRFNPDLAGDWRCVIGLKLLPQGGVDETSYVFTIEEGKMEIKEGEIPETADMILKTAVGTWASLLLGKRAFETAFLTGKLKIDGKAEHGLKLKEVLKL
ncbi:MAG: Gfo/Idh/MocA family oxidoreductase, partial [Deltaproteobacteria bacterium]|nr:Gfo/Idh/MocA family oxidoreductase [Deltaproteobacteria bacterium]